MFSDFKIKQTMLRDGIDEMQAVYVLRAEHYMRLNFARDRRIGRALSK